MTIYNWYGICLQIEYTSIICQFGYSLLAHRHIKGKVKHSIKRIKQNAAEISYMLHQPIV